MKYFEKINLPTYNNLYEELKKLDLSWFQNQISLNTLSNEPENYHKGCGSLVYDWTKSEYKDGVNIVPKYDNPLEEKDFNTLCTVFQNTIFEEIYNNLSTLYILGRVRIMKSKPKTCLSWHTDSTPRLHYPIKTQKGCIMVIENETMHIPQNEWWLTNTIYEHSAFNGSNEERIHLVATILS